jgi:predicted  nucleic acid-binding Zn-ribbon protein
LNDKQVQAWMNSTNANIQALAKNDTNQQSWIEYFNHQISNLTGQLSSLLQQVQTLQTQVSAIQQAATLHATTVNAPVQPATQTQAQPSATTTQGS